MILRIRKNTAKPNLYGRFFLASEADDGETSRNGYGSKHT